MLTDIAKAWSNRDVRWGFYGTLLIAIGSHTPAYLPQASPIWEVLRYLGLTGMATKWIGTAIVLVGLMLLINAWFRMRSDRELRYWTVLLIWVIPFLFSPPIFSHDAYSYAAHGWLIQNGMNPYEVGPGTLPGTYADQVSWLWRFTASPYGPLSLRISYGFCWLTGFDPYWSAILMRIPALAGVALIGYFLPKVVQLRGEDPHMAGWFVLLNPILVIDFVGGAHNDSLMVGLMVFAIWVACKTRRWLLAAAIVGLAAAIKQPALLTAVALPFLVHPWSTWRRRETSIAAVRVVLSLAVAVGVFALISIATGFGFGWMNAVEVPGMILSIAPFTLIGSAAQFLLDLCGLDPSGNLALRSARIAGLLTAAGVVIYLAIRRLGTRPLRFLSWSYLTIAFCAPALHAWYLSWGGVLLPLSRPNAKVVRLAVGVTLVLLCYEGVGFSVRNQAWALGIAVLGAVYWMFRADRKKETASVD